MKIRVPDLTNVALVPELWSKSCEQGRSFES